MYPRCFFGNLGLTFKIITCQYHQNYQHQYSHSSRPIVFNSLGDIFAFFSPKALWDDKIACAEFEQLKYKEINNLLLPIE